MTVLTTLLQRTSLNVVLTTLVQCKFTDYTNLSGRNEELTPPRLLVTGVPLRGMMVVLLVAIPKMAIDREGIYLVHHPSV